MSDFKISQLRKHAAQGVRQFTLRACALIESGVDARAIVESRCTTADRNAIVGRPLRVCKESSAIAEESAGDQPDLLPEFIREGLGGIDD